MMSIRAIILLLALASSAHGFFDPWSTRQRIRKSSVVAVFRITADEVGHVKAVVVRPLMGTKKDAAFRIRTDSPTSGRDPSFEVGQSYLIYLEREVEGRWVTPQSALDSLKIVGNKIEREAGNRIERDTNSKFEPLHEKLTTLRNLIKLWGKNPPEDSD